MKSSGFARRVKTMMVCVLLTSAFAVRVRASTTERDDNNFREDVLVCEEAVSHAVQCCGFKVQGDACRFHHFYSTDDCGCDSTGTDGSRREDTRPVVSVSEGQRIAKESCESMRAIDESGASGCTRIHELLERDNDSSSYVTKNCR